VVLMDVRMGTIDLHRSSIQRVSRRAIVLSFG